MAQWGGPLNPGAIPKPVDMYGRYPPYVNAKPGQRFPQQPENRSMVYCVLVMYSIMVALVGYFVGQQAFDPVEQAKFEARHWSAQAQTWQERVNDWKNSYNRHANLMPGEPEPCPVCDECEAPTFCFPRKGAECPAELVCGEVDPGDGSASPSAEGSDISVSPPPLDEALLDPAVKPMEGEESKNATDDTQEAADTEHESQEEEAKPEPSNSVVPEADSHPSKRRSHSSLATGFSELLGWGKKQGAEGSQSLQCPACPICKAGGSLAEGPGKQLGLIPSNDPHHAACDKQAILERLDAEDKKARARPAKYQSSYQAKKHCLELTMPAVFEAYEETVKARSTAGRHLMQVDVGDVLLSG